MGNVCVHVCTRRKYTKILTKVIIDGKNIVAVFVFYCNNFVPLIIHNF